VRNFGSVVKIASDANAFIAACKEALAEPNGETIERGLQLAGENSWESIVDRLEGHIQDVITRKQEIGVCAD